MGQSREVSRTRDDSPDKRPTSSNDQLPAKKQVHWLDGRNDGQIVSHETARTSSPERGRDRTPEHLQNDQPVSPDASSRRDSSPFRASAQKVFDGLLKEMKPEKPQVQKNSEMIQMSGTIERDRDEIKTGEKLEEEMEHHRGLFDNMRQKETRLLEIDKNITRELFEELKEQGEEHPLFQEVDRLGKEADFLREQLDKGPLREEIPTWDKQQAEKEMEHHRGLFDNMRQKETRLLEIDKNITRELFEEIKEQGEEHPLSQEVDRLGKEADFLREQLDKGPLRDEVEAWYQQQAREEEMESHRGLFDELQQHETRLKEINRSINEEVRTQMKEQGERHPITQEVSRTVDKIFSLRDQLNKGPLKGEVKNWDEQQEQTALLKGKVEAWRGHVEREEEEEYYRGLSNELRQGEARLLEIERNMTEKLQHEINEQDENHPIIQETYRIEDKIALLKKKLENRPIEDEMQTWDRQQEVGDIRIDKSEGDIRKYREIEEVNHSLQQRFNHKTYGDQLREREQISRENPDNPLPRKGDKVQWILGGSDIESDTE